ncbi:MAG: hypothetical protein ACYSU1_06485 [Planctomycetota bacterium]
MTPPKEKPSWDFSEFLKWLAHHPEALEPGLRMLDHGLDLGAEATVEVVGIDGLGRPCLMVDVDSFSPTTYDHILLLIARLKGGGERYRNLFARPTEPRMFLLAPKFPEEVRERLELLTHAFPLRCFRIGPPTRDRSTPLVEVEEIVDVDCPMDHLDGLDPETDAKFLRRLLQACTALQPPVLCRGGDWPLLLQGQDGLLATLLREDGRVAFSVSGQVRGSPMILLDDDESVDLAIDHLLRAQEKDGSSHAA